MNDGVKDSNCFDLICDRTQLSQTGELARDYGFGPRKPPMRYFSAFFWREWDRELSSS
jgi:hypothetical protein